MTEGYGTSADRERLLVVTNASAGSPVDAARALFTARARALDLIVSRGGEH